MQKYTTGEKEKTEIENSDFLQNLTHQLSDAQELGKTSPYRKSTVYYENHTAIGVYLLQLRGKSCKQVQ